MTENIKELEAKLAKAKKEEAKKAGFTVVVFSDDSEDLVEIKVKAHDLTEKEKADIMEVASQLGNNIEEIQEVAGKLDSTVGTWLKFMALIEDPLKGIIAKIFDLEKEIVATLPNIELLGLVLEGNQWINDNANNLAKELKYIASKNEQEKK
ncbi:hypothetical protein ACFC3Z_07885 [Enterococcus thailandicus]|uniref:hypothetical protein n=1 Tax=Enterococcus thailandicus TaxID=417368 RepID=UPI0035E0DF2E